MLIISVLYMELETLRVRKEKLCLSFAKKNAWNLKGTLLYSVDPVVQNHQLRSVELIAVNYARTEKYRKSATPYMQRKLKSLW